MSFREYRITAEGIDELGTDECWRLLETARIGRLAVVREDGDPEIFPVDFVAHRSIGIMFRSSVGAKLTAIGQHPRVAFEAEGGDRVWWWSIVARGVARVIEDPMDAGSADLVGLVTSIPAATDHAVRIVPDALSGRRFRPQHDAASPHEARRRPSDPPTTVPHYLPFDQQRRRA